MRGLDLHINPIRLHCTHLFYACAYTIHREDDEKSFSGWTVSKPSSGKMILRVNMFFARFIFLEMDCRRKERTL